MWQKTKLLIMAGLVVCGFFQSYSPVHADENFETSISTTYTVTPSGNTFVTEEFTITNKKPTLFVKQYAIEYGSTKLRNVRVASDKGEVPANVVNTENKTSIGITFPDQIVGEGKKRSFTVQFENPDTAVLSGNVLEVYVPQLGSQTEFQSHKVVIQVPLQYGRPARVSPGQYQLSATDRHLVLTFPDVKQQSITALFGERQIFDFSLKYELENPTSSIGIIQIALPPDTPYQKILYNGMDPLPKEITSDTDGNWIATYEIAAQKTLDVVVNGQAVIYLDPTVNVPVAAPSENLVSAQKYWEFDNPKIQQVAALYKTPRDIYDYTVKTLHYNYQKTVGSVERLGATQALEQPTNAACQEFTDVFVAVARANNIPARRLTGYAYTANSRLRPLSLVEDVLHAWPEYYDQERNTWIPIDPTWGNTTAGVNYFDQFDFNHLVFAINGSSSTTPYAAGAYKRSPQQSKNITVSFGQATTEPELAAKISIQRDFSSLAFWRNRYRVEVENTTGVAFYDQKLQLSSTSPELTLLGNTNVSLTLLPFQKQTVYVYAQAKNPFLPQRFDLTASLEALSSRHELVTGLPISGLVATPQARFGLVGGVVFVALVTGGVLVLRRAR